MQAKERKSRLPGVGTTIFTLMSQAAEECGALNLSQGFPAFNPPDALLALVARHLKEGHNQYAPMAGVPRLTAALADQAARRYGRSPDPDTEITITAGATEGLFCAIQAVLHPDDEAVILDPSYDSYAPAVQLTGASAKRVPLSFDPHSLRFGIDWERLQTAMNDATRLLIINFPHNPSGATLDAADLDRLADLLERHDTLLLADEVYEHIVFDDRKHHSALANDRLWPRSLVVSSFGKSLHATGWKIGYCMAPPALSREFRKIHQFTTFSVSTPMQHAIADYLEEYPDFAQALARFYQAKRDLFLAELEGSRFRYAPAASTFFQMLDYSEISDDPDTELALRWTRAPGVASIPVSVFCERTSSGRLLRFCFAKDDATLADAARRLRTL
ncbi:MAG: methionine aminotransferase [Pseudomonadota bacterium]